ncbi:MAG: hypothetical protein AABZ32_06735 [Bacteroidota bacterium]
MLSHISHLTSYGEVTEIVSLKKKLEEAQEEIVTLNHIMEMWRTK